MITEDRIKHSLGVARTCREIARQKGMTEKQSDAMFIMGLLHDIGYEDEPNSSHGHKSSEMIMSFKEYIDECCGAIACHGLAFDNWTVYDEVLNLADITTSHTGEKTICKDRLDNIADRYGNQSAHYKHAMEVVSKLKDLDHDMDTQKL